MGKKEDLQFEVNLNLSNRNFTMESAKFHISTTLVTTSLMATGYALFLSLSALILKDVLTIKELILLNLVILLFLVVCYIPFFLHTYSSWKRDIRASKKFNEQYLEKYFQLKHK